MRNCPKPAATTVLGTTYQESQHSDEQFTDNRREKHSSTTPALRRVLLFNVCSSVLPAFENYVICPAFRRTLKFSNNSITLNNSLDFGRTKRHVSDIPLIGVEANTCNTLGKSALEEAKVHGQPNPQRRATEFETTRSNRIPSGGQPSSKLRRTSRWLRGSEQLRHVVNAKSGRCHGSDVSYTRSAISALCLNGYLILPIIDPRNNWGHAIVQIEVPDDTPYAGASSINRGSLVSSY
ncbi:hypothetical protein J6590_041454 [Homalodisca vitripennis]|nr:hypothetical protein J6590_041454 [Homalodisca vitripennis]